MSLDVFFLVIEMKSILVFVFHVSLYSLQSIINSGSYKERQNKFRTAIVESASPVYKCQFFDF
jgi:hypothetical protein